MLLFVHNVPSIHQNLTLSNVWVAAPSGSDIALSARALASESENNGTTKRYRRVSYVLRGHRSLLSSDQTHLPLHQMTLPQHRMAQGFQPVYTEIVGTIKTLSLKGYVRRPFIFYLLPHFCPLPLCIILEFTIFLRSLLFYPLGFRRLQSFLQ